MDHLYQPVIFANINRSSNNNLNFTFKILLLLPVIKLSGPERKEKNGAPSTIWIIQA